MEMAEGRVRGGLLMGELAQQNNISADGAKVRQAIQTIASTYEQPAEIMQMYYGNPATPSAGGKCRVGRGGG